MTQHVFSLYHSGSSIKDGQSMKTTREGKLGQEAAVISQMTMTMTTETNNQMN